MIIIYLLRKSLGVRSLDAPNTGLFARVRAGLRSLTEALDYSGFDYVPDRINSADQEIARLKALLERGGINVAPSNEPPNRRRSV